MYLLCILSCYVLYELVSLYLSIKQILPSGKMSLFQLIASSITL